MMKEFGANICPLAVVGMFMNYAGNHILNHISNEILKDHAPEQRRVFYPGHEVMSITLLDNGDILTTALVLKPGEQEEKTLVQFRSKAIILSNGASQMLHPLFYKTWFPFMKTPSNKEKVIISDHFLKRDVYKSVMTKIVENKLKKIVIIGGSHSGYSCAWLMLNGPSSYHKYNYLKTVKWGTFPESHKFRN